MEKCTPRNHDWSKKVSVREAVTGGVETYLKQICSKCNEERITERKLVKTQSPINYIEVMEGHDIRNQKYKK